MASSILDHDGNNGGVITGLFVIWKWWNTTMGWPRTILSEGKEKRKKWIGHGWKNKSTSVKIGRTREIIEILIVQIDVLIKLINW